MLVRAAQRASSRRLPSFQSEATWTRDAVRSSCTAPTRRPFSTSRLNLNPKPSVKSLDSRDPRSVASERHYNTATSFNESPTDLPFVYPPPKITHTYPEHSKKPSRGYDASRLLSGAIEKPDLSALIILNTPELPISEPSSMKKAYDPFNLGVSTKKEDLSSTFQACIKIGRLERAETTLTKMMELETLSAKSDREVAPGEDILDMHNAFLVALLDHMKALSGYERKNVMEKIRKWHSESMKDLNDNAKTYAILMELAYHENPDQRLLTERKWKQYISKWRAKNTGLLGDVFKQPVLSPATLQEIFRVCRTQSQLVYI